MLSTELVGEYEGLIIWKSVLHPTLLDPNRDYKEITIRK